MVDVNTPSENVLKDVLASGHSRLPVFEDDQDNVIGILHVKDILKHLTRANVETDTLNMKSSAIFKMNLTKKLQG